MRAPTATRQLPGAVMQTFTVDTPTTTHWRKATCAEVECGPYLHGFSVELDPVAQEREVHAVRTSGRKPAAVINQPGRVTFVFEAGTPCMRAATHRLPLGRPELYVVRAGRAPITRGPDGHLQATGLPAGGVRQLAAQGELIRQHTRPEHFVEDMSEQTDAVITRIMRG